MAEIRVVVTGLGVVAPNGVGLPAFTAALRESKSGITFHQHLADAGFGCQVGGIPAGIAELQKQYLRDDELFAMNPNMVYAAIAGIDAWTDAGLTRIPPDADEVDWDSGAIVGTGIGGIDTIAEKLAPKVDAGKVSRLGSTMVEQIMSSGNTARLAGLLGLGNQVTTNSSACSTGTEAIIGAFLRIRGGHAQRMLAGGSEGPSKYTWAGFDAMKVLNRTRNATPRCSAGTSTAAGTAWAAA